ncbi:hypothetical protein M1N58_00935 [Dehalococcoidales bacterium]|nr:hypothetical protein [Dehalococcoidales bacterium]
MSQNIKSGLHLVIAGNRNINTFANTLRAVTNYWRNLTLEAVHLVRFGSSEKEKMPDWRGLCYTLLSKLPEYHEVVIPDITTYATVIPRLFRQLLIEQNIAPDSIIVDMTNGTKTWCDFVYLVCTLMQVTNLFRVKVPKKFLNYPYEEVDVKLLTVQFEPVLKLNDLKWLVRSTYSEYIFYLKEVTEFVNWMRTESSLTLDSERLYERLLKAFEHYMRSDYDSCILSVATILEEILDEIFRIMGHQFGELWMTLINNRLPANSLGSKAHTLGQACIRINYLVAGVENSFTKSTQGKSFKELEKTFEFAPLIPIGNHIQSLAMIRNYSAHGIPYSSFLQTETDARQILHGVLYIFGKMRICRLFRRD